MMAALGFIKSLLPRPDVEIYLRDGLRIPIDFADGWDIPYADLVQVLNAHRIDEDAVARAYRDVYPDDV